MPLSLAALLQLAQKTANQELAPDRTDLLTQQTRANEQATRQAEMLKGLYAAAADAARSLGPQIGQTYTNAANQRAAYGQGFSGGFKNLEQGSADQINAQLAKLGAPQGQMVAGDKGGADVLYGLGGALPAGTLASQGAAFKSAADFLPSTTLGRGAQAVQSTNYNATLKNQEFADQLKTLDAKFPGLVRDVYSQLVQNQSQSTAADVNRALGIFQTTGKVTPQIAKLLGIPAGTKTLAQQRLEQQGKAASAKLHQPDAGLSKIYGYVVDSNGQPISGPDGQRVKIKVKGAAAKARSANAELSKSLGYVVDDLGRPILNGGKKVVLPKKPGAVKQKKPLGLDQKTYSKQTALALGAARNYHSTWTDKDGNQQDPLTWQQYLTHGLNAGIDPRILVKQGRRVYSQREIKLGLVPVSK